MTPGNSDARGAASAASSQVPEFDDGGYWYVQKAVSAEDSPGWRFDEVITGCAWYKEVGGQMMCAIRTPDPVDIPEPENSVVVAQIVGAIKPHGRIKGR